MTKQGDGVRAWHEKAQGAIDALEHCTRITGPIPNAHLFFELPQAERERRLAETMVFAMEQAQAAIRFSFIATIKGIADRKGIEMDLSKVR